MPGITSRLTHNRVWRYFQEILGNPQPLMGGDEIALIASHLRPDHVMLEWGCGGSTLYFSALVRQYYSIEHDEAWCRKIRRALQRHGRANVRLMHVPANLPLDGVPNYARTSARRLAQFRDYVETVDRLGVARFDRVLIDGRSRPECAVRVRRFLDPDSLVFIHDFFNTQYDPAEYGVLTARHYEIIDAITEGQSLAILRPK